MDKITTYKDLKRNIAELEYQQTKEFDILKSDISTGLKNLTPSSLFKGVLQSMSSKVTDNGGILSTSLAVLMGYISKKIFINTSSNPLKKMLGTLLLVLTTHLVTKHPEKIKMIFGFLVHAIRKITTSFANENTKEEQSTRVE
jgi:hypothetical protein